MATYVLRKYDNVGILRYVRFGWLLTDLEHEIHDATLFTTKNAALKKKYSMDEPEKYHLYEVSSSKCPIN